MRARSPPGNMHVQVAAVKRRTAEVVAAIATAPADVQDMTVKQAVKLVRGRCGAHAIANSMLQLPSTHQTSHNDGSKLGYR